MSVSIENQVRFYDWQLQEMDLAWAKYHRADIRDLYSSNKLYLGRIWGYDEKRGVLILKFKKGKFPRLKEPLTISYPKSSIGSFQNWSFSYGYFREHFTEQYSTCTTMFYLENDLNEGLSVILLWSVCAASTVPWYCLCLETMNGDG